MLVQLTQNDTLRVGFNPTKSTQEEYIGLTRLVDIGEFDHQDEEIKRSSIFDIDCQQTSNQVTLTTKSKYNSIVIKVVVNLDPFGIKVYNNSQTNSDFAKVPIWQTEEPGIYYTPHGIEDYAIIQAVQKPGTAKFVGFGEQGGTKLEKNSDQLNYFNLDNMRYRQIYNRGPLDNREPLYHWYYNEDINISFIKVFDNSSSITIQTQYV